MAVGDQNLTKISITPLIALIVDIPEDMQGSFYAGQVHVGIKENCFESSSALCHMTELSTILRGTSPKEILCLYTDGGPDHRVNFLSVQIALICLFLQEDRDMVLAVRTPPYNSWKDPAEWVMSLY